MKPAVTFFKVLRWIVLVFLIGVILIALKRPTPPAPALDPAEIKTQAKNFETKLNALEHEVQVRGTMEPAHFSSDEVNAFVQDAASRGLAGGSPIPATPAGQEAGTEIKSTQVAFIGDEVVAQAVTQRYGKDVYVTVRGHLSAQNGYLKFTSTGFKIGDLTVPVSLMDGPLKQKLSEPENREKMKLPDFVRDLRIEKGELVMVPK